MKVIESGRPMWGFASVFLLALLATPAAADTWRGTAPFCDGECLKGEVVKGTSNTGDGGYCVTGHKVLCGNASAMCNARETRSKCYGVVMVCENGYYESLNQNWHGCNSYACGACLGIGSISPQSTNGGGGGAPDDRCKQGYVWREAMAKDHVCVTPQTRTQARDDNAKAASRRAGGGAYGADTCKQGYVWREVAPDDHVCVTPQTRAQAREDNAQARGRVAPPAMVVVIDTCKQGYVWREAVTKDHVCVTPQTRTQARDDNAKAASRRAGGGAYGADTCKQGYVWREVVPDDRVCVTTETRDAAARDTAAAGSRVVQ